jgi:hypothetical protein
MWPVISSPGINQRHAYCGVLKMRGFMTMLFWTVHSMAQQPPSMSLNLLNGVNGFHMGDVNGDGLADMLMGAYFADSNGTNSGAAYVL